jgi:hypothetical protein
MNRKNFEQGMFGKGWGVFLENKKIKDVFL